MLYNIAFQDNIYVLLRQIDILCDGLKLDIDERLFSAKVLNDLIFFDRAITRLFEQIYPQQALQNFIEVLQGLQETAALRVTDPGRGNAGICLVKIVQVASDQIEWSLPRFFSHRFLPQVLAVGVKVGLV